MEHRRDELTPEQEGVTPGGQEGDESLFGDAGDVDGSVEGRVDEQLQRERDADD